MSQQSTFFPPEEHDIFSKLTDQTISPDAATMLSDELSCAVLDELHPHLDVFAKKSSSHIDPLHVHLYKRRAVTIVEQARLHLVWHSDTVYLKPLPTCLLSSDFWRVHLSPENLTRPQALGFVRTYAHLIRYRSDFLIAQKENLIPPSENLTYGEFEAFVRCFRDISDDQVSPRWKFGQLRLAWLDWAVRIFQPEMPGQKNSILRRLFYEEPYHQTRQFFHEFGAPLIFIFAALSLILSAMQVVLAARADNPWPKFALASAWFSMAAIILLVAVILFIFTVATIVLMCQLGFALRSRRGLATEAPRQNLHV